jgi:hypothetical protein
MTSDRSSAPTTEAKAFLGDLPRDSHLIVTVQIGCGQTILAKPISARFGLTHLHIDKFNDEQDPLGSAARAAG